MKDGRQSLLVGGSGKAKFLKWTCVAYKSCDLGMCSCILFCISFICREASRCSCWHASYIAQVVSYHIGPCVHYPPKQHIVLCLNLSLKTVNIGECGKHILTCRQGSCRSVMQGLALNFNQQTEYTLSSTEVNLDIEICL